MRRMLLCCLLVLPGTSMFATPGVLVQGNKFLDRDAANWAKDLKDTDFKARRGAAFALGKLGLYAANHLPALIDVVADDRENPTVRDAAAFALGEIYKSAKGSPQVANNPRLLPALVKVLENPQEPDLVRRSAAYALGCMGPNAQKALPALANVAGDKSAAVRQNVATALGQIDKNAVATLRKMLVNENDPQVVRATAKSLGKLGKAARPALPELLAFCRAANFDRDPQKVEMRKAVLSALVPLVGKDDRDAVAALKVSLQDPEPEVKRNAALALANIGGPEAADAVLVLLEALQSEKEEIEYRRQAAAALGNFGPAAQAAVPALIKALASSDTQVRMNAAVALGGIGDKSALAPLVKVIANKSEDRQVRKYAAVSVRDVGVEKQAAGAYKAFPELASQLPTLAKVIDDFKDDPDVRALALWPIRFLDDQTVQQNPEVLQTLEKIVTSEPKIAATKMLRYDSACLLGRFQGKKISQAAMNTLDEFLRDEQVLIYVGTRTDVPANVAEGQKLDAKIKTGGKGDGRITVIQALTFVGEEKLREFPNMIKQMRTLAEGVNTDRRLKELTKKVLEEWGL